MSAVASPDNSIEAKSILLERFMVCAANLISVDALEVMASTELRYEAESVAAMLQAYIWAEEIQDDTASLTVEWPATVWQAFKERWFPRAWLRRWPVKLASRTTTHRFVVKATLPEYKYIPQPQFGRVVLKATSPGSFRFRGDKPETDE